MPPPALSSTWTTAPPIRTFHRIIPFQHHGGGGKSISTGSYSDLYQCDGTVAARRCSAAPAHTDAPCSGLFLSSSESGFQGVFRSRQAAPTRPWRSRIWLNDGHANGGDTFLAHGPGTKAPH